MRKENKGKDIYLPAVSYHFIYSEKKIESLKNFYAEANVPISSKWREVEKHFKDDPEFLSSEPLEQIT